MKHKRTRAPGAGRPRTSTLVRVTFALEPATLATLDEFALRSGLSKAAAVKQAILQACTKI